MMHFYKGALTEHNILNMSLVKFLMYNDYMNYIARWSGDEDDIKHNERLDRMDEIRYGKKNSDEGMKNFKRQLMSR